MLKHYRPFCCSETARNDQNRVRVLRKTGLLAPTVFLIALVGSTILPRIALSQTASASAVSSTEAYRRATEAFDRKDYATALQFYRKAADQGSADAQWAIGTMYEYGWGVKQEDTLALGWYRKAADQGNTNAQVNLGLFYAAGRGGLPIKEDEAMRLYKLAADRGNAFAQLDLAWMYEAARGGLLKNEQEAARLYKLSADQDNPGAQFRLGLMYEDGRGGLTKSSDEAKRLYKLAADQGDEGAQKALRRLSAIANGPSDDDIIRALSDQFKRDTLEATEKEFQEDSSLAYLSCFMAKNGAEHSACAARNTAMVQADHAAKLKQIQAPDYYTSRFDLLVQEKKNYENNYVAIVKARQRGSDKTWRQKLLLEFKDEGWVVTERDEQQVQ